MLLILQANVYMRKISGKRYTMWTCHSMSKEVESGSTRPHSGAFRFRTLLHIYEKNVHPVNITDLQAEATDNSLPPVLKRGKGRPRTRRIRKGERQLRRKRRERQGLLPDVEDRLTNCCRLCGCRAFFNLCGACTSAINIVAW